MRKTNLWSGLISAWALLLSFALHAQEQAPYFQQDVDYTIRVELDDHAHVLRGEIQIEYTNNSPDQLDFLYLHLWPNAYESDRSALARQFLENRETEFYFSEEFDRGGIDSLRFLVDGLSAELTFGKENTDIAKLMLPSPLPSGGKVVLTSPFKVKIPDGRFSRLGHEEQAYQITQWYPKPAVYDRNGWHPYPYLNQGEFYSEFGSFDVSITLPENYVVGATGDLQTLSEIQWLDEKANETAQITDYSNDLAFPPSSPRTKTIRYTQSRVHDFAWFADKRYHVLKGEIELPHSGRTVTTWSMYTNLQADLWKNSLPYIGGGIYHYSLWNGDYPYNQMTAVEGALSAGAGMEYPNITVIGESSNAFLLEVVIVHEVGHNWFYGILGSDERLHPWMDEGINTYNEGRYVEWRHPKSSLLGADENSGLVKFFDLGHFKYTGQYYLGYLLNARRNRDQAITTAADEMTQINYGAITYGKTGLAFRYLAGYLGQEDFDRAMKAYFEEWKFKHPGPKDLRAVLERETGKDLSWFFDELLPTTLPLDYRIQKVKAPRKGGVGPWEVTVRNRGKIAGPVAISTHGEQTTTTWHEGFAGSKTFTLPNGDYNFIKVDGQDQMPEYRRRNNTWQRNALLHKVEPYKLQFIGSTENPNRTQLFWAPAVGWNNYDKTMLGIGVYNSVVPEKPLHYQFVPMYGFGSRDLAGMGRMSLGIYPRQVARKIHLAVGGQRFHYGQQSSYWRLTPQIQVDFQRPRPRSPIERTLQLRSILLQTEQPGFAEGSTITQDEQFFEASYRFKNSRLIDPFRFSATFQYHEDFHNLAVEGQYRITYQKKSKGLDLRVFGGKFFRNYAADQLVMWRFEGQTGRFDYAYDHLFLDRGGEDDLFNRQFNDNQGAFKSPVFGGGNNALFAVNLKADLPIDLPIGVFADLGRGWNFGGNPSDWLFDAGVHLPIAKNIFEIYIPLAHAQPIRDYYDLNEISFAERIRFTLHLEKLNPFNLAEQFEL